MRRLVFHNFTSHEDLHGNPSTCLPAVRRQSVHPSRQREPGLESDMCHLRDDWRGPGPRHTASDGGGEAPCDRSAARVVSEVTPRRLQAGPLVARSGRCPGIGLFVTGSCSHLFRVSGFLFGGGGIRGGVPQGTAFGVRPVGVGDAQPIEIGAQFFDGNSAACGAFNLSAPVIRGWALTVGPLVYCGRANTKRFRESCLTTESVGGALDWIRHSLIIRLSLISAQEELPYCFMKQDH